MNARRVLATQFLALLAGSLFASGAIADHNGIWSLLSASGASPGSINSHAAVYDPIDRVMRIYTGTDVWTLTLGPNPQWTKLAPSGTPPPSRTAASAILDPIRHRLIIFGGYSGGNYDNSVWALTLGSTPSWTQLAPGGTQPPSRLYHTAIYDSVRDRMVIFGGENGPSLNDVWALALNGSPVWAQLNPTGTPPSGRYGHVSIYDPVSDRMLVFGGWDGNTVNGET